MSELTPKQAAFVDEYLIDLNATRAAIRAGYSTRTADVIATELLSKTLVAEAVAKAKAERSRRTGISSDRVLEELARIAFADMGEFVTFDADGVTIADSAGVDTRVVQEVKETPMRTGGKAMSIKLHDKLGALNALAKHLGLVPEKHEHEITLRREAERLAEEAGCTPDELLADVAEMRGQRT